ncbi:hypothetical protein ABMA27_014446 [Loxostege sticticalis]|uniref:C2H2-type domain-containing protein n=1 Tax=Loxostege sticticalis TaxID=481309 RepID=A0ABR3I8Y1_LOXSC
MEKYLRPEKFDANPSESSATQSWEHWRKTFESFIAAHTPAAPSSSDKDAQSVPTPAEWDNLKYQLLYMKEQHLLAQIKKPYKVEAIRLLHTLVNANAFSAEGTSSSKPTNSVTTDKDFSACIIAASPLSLRKATVPAYIRGIRAEAFLDTGSSITFINDNFAKLSPLGSDDVIPQVNGNIGNEDGSSIIPPSSSPTNDNFALTPPTTTEAEEPIVDNIEELRPGPDASLPLPQSPESIRKSSRIRRPPTFLEDYVMELPENNNGIGHEKSDFNSITVVDNENHTMSVMSGEGTKEVKENPNNIQKSSDKSNNSTNNMYSNIDTMSDVISTEENKSPNNNNKKEHLDNNSVMATNEVATESTVEVKESLKNEETQVNTDNKSYMDDNNKDFVIEVISDKDKEPCNKNKETQDKPDDSKLVMDDESGNMPELAITEEVEPPNENKETQDKPDNSKLVMDVESGNIPELAITGEVEPPNENKETQDKPDNSKLVMDVESGNIPELAITEEVEPPNNVKEKPLDEADSIEIPNMDIDTNIEETKTETASKVSCDNEVITVGNSDKSVNANEDSNVESAKTEVKEPPYDKEETGGNSDNSSNMKLEHMMSLKVVLVRTKYYGCDKCNLVFFRPYDQKLHSVKHVLPSKKNSDSDDRFVKRFKCDECGVKFVQLSTLEAHAAVHAPAPHVCHCGVGFYCPKDLNSHKNLVHLDEIREQLATLTDRKQRALKHQIWQPNVLYTIKKEPKSTKPKRRPKLRIELKPRTRREPFLPRYRCEEEKLIVQNDDKTFSCPICFKIFKSKAGTAVHLASHAEVKPYGCDLCDKRFTQVGALKLHKKRHAGIKEFKCNFCGKEFCSLNNMLNHVRTHTGEKPFKCSFCPKAFSDPSAHKRHERTHTGEKPYSCKFCGMRFSDASGLIAHERRHSGIKKIQCTQCPKRFYTKDALRKHTHTVHSHEKNFSCNVCNKSFAIKPYLYIHMKSHYESKRFECDYCGFRSRAKLGLMKHIETVHLHIKNEKCPDCGMRFYCKNVMQNHHRAVHSRPLNYECDICGERQSVRSLIAKHILEKHSEVRCTICRKPFANSADLQRHTDQEGCAQCECGKYFPNQMTLNSHRFVHTVKRPHPCSYCDKRFKNKSALRKHYVTVHENTKKFECNECGEQFSVRNHLQTHIFTIHLTLLYCHICKGHFYSESDLKAHKAKGHIFNNHQCDVCGKVFVKKTSLKTHLQIHDVDKFYCVHCPSKFKLKASMKRHIQLCHKDVLRTKSSRPK